MKKFLIAVLLIAGSFGYANAQTTPHAIHKKTKTTSVSTNAATSTPASVNANHQKVEKNSSTTTHLKADGTTDKRYKENKVKTTTTGPLKKDGTPDKRYKANKK